MSFRSEILGLSYLEPRRHVPHIQDLDGAEASTFGRAIALASSALKRHTRADFVFIYIFGEGVPHLHVHLAPNRPAHVLSTQIVKGDFIEQELPGGAAEQISVDYPLLDEQELRALAIQVRRDLHGARAGA
jgi:diadenosine tetraphosphate (Ap4A) HIT family hydrolase